MGHFGEVDAIERLVMYLLKLERAEEAFQRADAYFQKYRGDINRAGPPPNRFHV